MRRLEGDNIIESASKSVSRG